MTKEFASAGILNSYGSPVSGVMGDLIVENVEECACISLNLQCIQPFECTKVCSE